MYKMFKDCFASMNDRVGGGRLPLSLSTIENWKIHEIAVFPLLYHNHHRTVIHEITTQVRGALQLTWLSAWSHMLNHHAPGTQAK